MWDGPGVGGCRKKLDHNFKPLLGVRIFLIKFNISFSPSIPVPSIFITENICAHTCSFTNHNTASLYCSGKILRTTKKKKKNLKRFQRKWKNNIIFKTALKSEKNYHQPHSADGSKLLFWSVIFPKLHYESPIKNVLFPIISIETDTNE